MSNVVENKTQSNMHSHIDKAFKIIEEYLPSTYKGLVLDKMRQSKIKEEDLPSLRTILNVKNKCNGYYNQVNIIKALVEVSLDNKVKHENLKELLKS